MASSSAIDLQQEKTIDLIKDWCKWIISLSFTSGTGCVVVLQQGVSAAIKVYLVTAIVLFALTAIVSVIVIAVLPILMQLLPLVTKTGGPKNIYDYKIFHSWLSIKVLTILQIMLFAGGLVSLIMWIILKSPVT